MAEEERRGEGFLSRWSRLKQARREGARAQEAEPPASPEPPAGAAAPPAQALAQAPPPEPEEPEFGLASLPPIEALTAESDLSVFLRKGVPEMLRNAALRRVWSLDPTIRDFIGPADYAWDWNVPGGAPGYAATIAHGPDVEALADRILGLVRDPPSPRDNDAAGEREAGGTVAADAPAPELPMPEPPMPEPPTLEPPTVAVAGPVEAAAGVSAPALPAQPLPREDGAGRPAAPRHRHGGAAPV